MGRSKRVPGADRGGEVRIWHSSRGSSDKRGIPKEPEDDPLRDLRPFDEDPPDHEGYEYEWPDLSNEYEEDD